MVDKTEMEKEIGNLISLAARIQYGLNMVASKDHLSQFRQEVEIVSKANEGLMNALVRAQDHHSKALMDKPFLKAVFEDVSENVLNEVIAELPPRVASKFSKAALKRLLGEK